MKKLMICTALVLTAVIFTFGQKPKTTSAASGGVSGSGSLYAGSSVLAPGTRIDGQLENSVDVNKSRVGDPVILKTTKAIKQNGETIVPKGSRLIGRITEVQQRSKSNGASRLGMVFDRIEGSSLNAPISASIISITNAAVHSDVGNMADSDVFASSGTSTRASTGRSSGGGLLGGPANTVGGVTNSVGGVTGTAEGVLNTTTQTAGRITNTAGQTAGSTVGTVGRTVNGIQISNAVGGSLQSGTTLSSGSKDIRLEKGVQMQLLLNSAVQPK